MPFDLLKAIKGATDRARTPDLQASSGTAGLFTDEELQRSDQKAKNGELKYNELEATQAVAGRTKCQNCMGQCPGCKNSALEKFRNTTNLPFGKIDPSEIKLTQEQNNLMLLAASGDLQAFQKLQGSLQQQNQPDKPQVRETLVILGQEPKKSEELQKPIVKQTEVTVDQVPKKTQEPQKAIVKQTEVKVDETAVIARKAQEDLLLRDFLRRKDEERELEKAKSSKGEATIGEKRPKDELKKAEPVSFFVPVGVKTESALVTKKDDSPQVRSVDTKIKPLLPPRKEDNSAQPKLVNTKSRSEPRTKSKEAGSPQVAKKDTTANPRAKTSVRVGRAPNSSDPRAVVAVRLAKASRLKALRVLRKERASQESAKAPDPRTEQRLRRSTKSQIEVVRSSRIAESVKRTSKRETLNTAQTEFTNQRQSQNQSASRVSQQQATLQARQQELVSQQKANLQARLQSQRAAEQSLQDQLLRQQLASRTRPIDRIVQRNEPQKTDPKLGLLKNGKFARVERQKELKEKHIEIKKAAELIGGLEPKRLNQEIIKALLTVSSKSETREIVKAIKSLSSESQKILLSLDKKETLRDVLKLLATKTSNTQIKDLLKGKPSNDVLRQIRVFSKNLTPQGIKTVQLLRDQLVRELMLLIDQEADRKKKDALTKAIRRLLEESNDLEKLLISLKALSELRAKIRFKTPEKVEEKILKDQEERAKENEIEYPDEVEVKIKKGGKFKQQGPSTTLDIFQAQVDDDEEEKPNA
jgi:hypothetical protein